jgi:hypothetical protein
MAAHQTTPGGAPQGRRPGPPAGYRMAPTTPATAA